MAMEASVRDVYLVGVGMTPFGRFLDRSLKSLTEEAVALALQDAETEHGAIESIVFANATQDAMEGQYGIRGQAALAALPFDAVPIINVENACARCDPDMADHRSAPPTVLSEREQVAEPVVARGQPVEKFRRDTVRIRSLTCAECHRSPPSYQFDRM